MPRVSAQHEQAVRDRIVRAAIEVFAEHGFHRATMQDIVRRSGLSVGAIYTYFKSKSELILAGCDLITDQELGELRERLATVTDYRERVATALGFFFDQFEEQRSGAARRSDDARLGRGRRRPGDPGDGPPPAPGDRRPDGAASPGRCGPRRAAALARCRERRPCVRGLLDGLTIEAIEDGPAYRRDDAEKRALAMLELLFAARGRRASVPLESAAPPRLRLAQGEPGVVTDAQSRPSAGRSTPELGFTLPHEHTAIALWHIPNRWDYWELRRDEPIITAELAAFREKAAAPPRRPDPAGRRARPRLAGRALDRRRPAHRHGRAAGIARPTTRPEALIDRRTVDDLADEIVREATEESRGVGIKAGIIGEIGTDKPWLSAQEERVHRAAARAARRTGLAITTHAVQSTVGLDQLTVFEAEGADLSRVVIGHADSYPDPPTTGQSSSAARSVEFDFLGMSFTPLERHGEGRIVESSATCSPRATSSGSCCRRTSATTPAPPLRRQRLHVPGRHVPAAATGRRGLRRRDPDDHGRQPAAAADDRLSGRAPSSTRIRGPRARTKHAAARTCSADVCRAESVRPSRPACQCTHKALVCGSNACRASASAPLTPDTNGQGEARTRPGAPQPSSSVASTDSSTLPFNAFEIGQPSFALSAASRRLASVAPGTTALTVIADERTVQPVSSLSP